MLGGNYVFNIRLFLLTQRKERSQCVLQRLTAWADVQRSNYKVAHMYSVLYRFMFPSAIEELYFPEIGLPLVIPRDRFLVYHMCWDMLPLCLLPAFLAHHAQLSWFARPYGGMESRPSNCPCEWFGVYETPRCFSQNVLRPVLTSVPQSHSLSFYHFTA